MSMDSKATSSANMKYTIPVKHIPSKRIFDILFSSAIMVLFSPLYLILCFLAWSSSPGPIFFITPRVGRGGKIIHCVKFRTMYKNADEVLKEILLKDKDLAEEYAKFCKLKKDPRITPIGRFLRKMSLDELPQFWNVLKGDLSVVGPRPAFLDEIKSYYGEKAIKILSYRPGITGIWQTSGRNHLPMSERVRLEEVYVENQTFFKDLILICKTIPVMLFSKGAY